MSEYTAEDFRNVDFARHPSGRLAHRLYDNLDGWHWAIEERGGGRDRVMNNYMAEDGWAPTPTKPTLTAGQAGRHAHLLGPDVEAPSVIDYLEALGIEVIPDPEPTNAEKLAEIFRDAPVVNREDAIHGDDAITAWAEYLDANGVKAGN